MNRLKYSILLLIYYISISTASGQDAVFSQYFSSSLYLNPCFAGLEPYLNVGVNVRNQWSKASDQAYTTNQLSIIAPIYKEGLRDANVGGVGLSVYQDKAGALGYQSLGANVSGAYNLLLGAEGKHTVTFGLQAGVIQKSLVANNLQWGSQFDKLTSSGFNAGLPVGGFNSDPSTFGSVNNTVTASKLLVDIGAGIMYYYRAGRPRREKGASFWAGYSGYHLNGANESFVPGSVSKLPILNKAIAGFEFTLGSRFNISPNALVAMQAGNTQINAGTYITYMLVEPDAGMLPSDIIIGGWYRVGDSFIASVGLASKVYTLGFSFDLNTSNLSKATNSFGAWEVSLKIQKPRKEKVKRYYTPRI